MGDPVLSVLSGTNYATGVGYSRSAPTASGQYPVGISAQYNPNESGGTVTLVVSAVAVVGLVAFYLWTRSHQL